MENKEVNQTVSRLYKEFKALNMVKTVTKADENFYYNKRAEISDNLVKIARCVGAIEVMSKKNIIRLCAMQSSYRFMELHTFLMLFSKAVEYTN